MTGSVEGPSSGFIREPDGTVTLIDVPDAVSTVLNGINDAGVIVGNFRDSAGTNHAMRMTSPDVFDFFEVGSLTTATSIASDGVIAGATYAGRRFNRNTFGGFLLRPDSAVGVALPCSPAIVAEGVDKIHSNAFQDLVGSCILDVPGARPFGRFMIAANGRTMKESFDAPFAGINDTGQIITTQDGTGVIMTPCAVSPVSTALSVPADGGFISVNLNNPAPDCKPLAFSNSEWISIVRVGPENSTLQFLSIAANVGDTSRVGTIYLAGADVTITQAGGSCQATLTPGAPPFVSTAMFPGSGGTGMLTITVTSGCAWTASADVPWIKFTGPFSGTSTSTISYTVEPNPISAARRGLILVGLRPFLVIQAAGSPTGG